LAENKPIL